MINLSFLFHCPEGWRKGGEMQDILHFRWPNGWIGKRMVDDERCSMEGGKLT